MGELVGPCFCNPNDRIAGKCCLIGVTITPQRLKGLDRNIANLEADLELLKIFRRTPVVQDHTVRLTQRLARLRGLRACAAMRYLAYNVKEDL